MDSGKQENRRRPTILILDDEEVLRDMLGNGLREAGYETVDYADKEDGYDWACENHVDLIISDVMSRTMDGFSLLKFLKAHAVTKPIPVVIVTGCATFEVAIQILKLGGADFVSKPVELSDLLQTIERILAGSASRRGQKCLPLIADLFISTKEDVLRAPWYRIRKILLQLLEAQQSRTLLFDRNYVWSEYFLIEDQHELVGCCLCRPSEYASLPRSRIYAFRKWLDSQGLQFGVLYSFFDADPGDLEFAELLGIAVVQAKPTLEMLARVAREGPSGGESLLPSERGLRLSPLAGEFQAFWTDALQKAQNLTVPVMFTIDPKEPGSGIRSVKCEMMEYGSLNFLDESSDAKLWLSEADFSHVLSRLWRRRSVERHSLAKDELRACCIGEVLVFLGLATRSEDTYYLKGT
jgi:DNA-binding response OmpR family regulator